MVGVAFLRELHAVPSVEERRIAGASMSISATASPLMDIRKRVAFESCW